MIQTTDILILNPSSGQQLPSNCYLLGHQNLKASVLWLYNNITNLEELI